MPALECATRRTGGVALVACRLSNDRDEACRVRLDPRTDATCPPRTNGLPAAGWIDGRCETVLPAGATVGLGFATPERPPDPPADLTVVASGADPPSPSRSSPSPLGSDDRPAPTAADAVRTLPDPRPPRAARPDRAGDRTWADQRAGSRGGEPDDRTTRAGSHGPDREGGDGRADGPVPPAVAAWLARAERQEDRAALRAVARRVRTARDRAGAGGR